MKGKHLKKTNNTFSKLFILAFFILLIVIIFIIYKKVIHNQSTVSTIDNNNQQSEIIHNINSGITSSKTVENCDFLEVTGLNITTQDGYSSIKTNIINNSNNIISNFVLNISIFDSNNNLITKLSNPVESISPGESLQAFGVVKENISNAYSYKVEKN